MAKSFLSILVIDYQDTGKEEVIFEIPIDICKSRTPKYTAELTKFPTEAGTPITDNRKIEPIGYDIEGVVSNTPVVPLTTINGSLRGDGLSQSSRSSLPAQAAHDALVDLHESGRLVTIIDQFRQYKDMALVSLSFPRTKDTGDAIEFSASFQKVQIVSTSAAALPADVLKKLKKRPKISKSARLAKLKAQLMKRVITDPNFSAADAKKRLADAAKGKASKTPRK